VNLFEFLDETYRAKTRGMGLLYGENCTILTSTVLHESPVWRTVRETDRRNCDSILCALSIYAVARKKFNRVLSAIQVPGYLTGTRYWNGYPFRSLLLRPPNWLRRSLFPRTPPPFSVQIILDAGPRGLSGPENWYRMSFVLTFSASECCLCEDRNKLYAVTVVDNVVLPRQISQSVFSVRYGLFTGLWRRRPVFGQREWVTSTSSSTAVFRAMDVSPLCHIPNILF